MAQAASDRFVGRSLPRREDRRLLVGRGQYVSDLVLPGMLHVAFVRSPLAHARIRSLDLTRAANAPGVALVLSAVDLQRALPPLPDHRVPMPRKWREAVAHKISHPRQPLLAADKVHHAGEAIALVVAESRHCAEDAAALAVVDLEPLPAVIDPEAALAPDAPLLHEHLGSNLIGEMSVHKGDVERALAEAPHRLSRRFYHHRYAAMPMECRGVVGAYDSRTDSLTIWSSTQMVHMVRAAVANTLGLPEARVRCVAPDVGGGFGVKGHAYPEEPIIAFLARRLGRPVRWIEDRYEHFLCACQSRDQIHDVEIGFDDSGRILALRDRIIGDSGAFNPLGAPIAYNTIVHLPGPYRIDHLAVTYRIVCTNKVANAPYRGAGRPEAVQAMERSIDLIAQQLGLEPAEVRLRNMIRADEMPYSVGIPYRDGEPILYDSGDYPAAAQKALDALGGIEAFRRRQRAARQEGRHLGLGLGCYTEGTGVGPFEGATVRIETTGKIYVTSGACPQGQGMETIFSQIAADQWKVAPDDVIVALADTATIPMGFGTIASRSTVTFSTALHHASMRLLTKARAIAANLLECDSGDLELRDGGLGIVGVPGRSVTLAQIAAAARPGWDHARPPGIDAGLEETFYYEPPTVTWAYAVHAAVVEVDIETGGVKIDRYVIAHDCGVTVNPMLVEGQVIGGTVQGLGGALLEELAFNAQGQPLSVSLADYLLPTASDLPHFELVHQQIPSPLNPLGVKGLGEGGAIAPPVAIANAVADALAPFGVEFNHTPIKPGRIVDAVRAAKQRRAASLAEART